MSIFVTSDTHFNHFNMACAEGSFGEHSRGFASVQEMNEKIIENWNRVVRPDDIVYHLGDVALNNISNLPDILGQLNGNIILVRGNHDSKRVCKVMRDCGVDIIHSCVVIKDKIKFTLRHIPNYDWHGDYFNIMLYGHVHDTAPHGLQKNFSYHVGLDTNDLTPVNLDDIIKDIKENNFV